MFGKKEIIILVIAALVGLILAYSCRLEAGEWNEKPVMCADEKETQEVLNVKKEKILFMGNGFTKIRSESGLAKKPVTLPFRLYVNKETGTFTVVEHHPEYKTYCVIAYGVNFQDFREML